MAKQIKKHGKVMLILGLTMVLLMIYAIIPSGQAASISSRNITITDSRASQASVTYTFTGTHSGTTVKCLKIQFCQAASGSCTIPSNMSVSSASATSTSWNGWTYSDWSGGFATSSTGFQYTYATGEGGGAGYVFAGTGITNSDTVGTYYASVNTYTNADCSSGGTDSGVAAFAIVSGVTVSATVPETLTFQIAQITNSACDGYFGPLGGPDSATTTVAFGSLASTNTFYHACQDLTVSTNANSGYGVTGHETTNLWDSTNSNGIADSTGDSGSMSESATSAWTTNTNNGFGYTCGDVVSSDCSILATSSYRQFACVSKTDAECDPNSGDETAQTIMASSSPVSASQGRIEYKLSIGGTQEAGSYSNVIVYIATPTY